MFVGWPQPLMALLARGLKADPANADTRARTNGILEPKLISKEARLNDKY
jgi:hypothetical protein